MMLRSQYREVQDWEHVMNTTWSNEGGNFECQSKGLSTKWKPRGWESVCNPKRHCVEVGGNQQIQIQKHHPKMDILFRSTSLSYIHHGWAFPGPKTLPCHTCFPRMARSHPRDSIAWLDPLFQRLGISSTLICLPLHTTKSPVQRSNCSNSSHPWTRKMQRTCGTLSKVALPCQNPVFDHQYPQMENDQRTSYWCSMPPI